MILMTGVCLSVFSSAPCPCLGLTMVCRPITSKYYRYQECKEFYPSLPLCTSLNLAKPIESTVFTFVLPQTAANALDAAGTQRGPECKSVFFVHPQRNNQNSYIRNTRVLFLLCNYIYIASNPVSSASTDRDSCLVLNPLS